MRPEEYANLMELLGRSFARIEQRFDSLDTRMTSLEGRVSNLEVSFEAFRHDVRAWGEYTMSNGERITRIERLISAA